MKIKKVLMLISFSILGLVTFTSCGKHTHEFESTYSKDASAHWQKAICEHTDEKQNYGSHTYGEFVVTKEATHTEDGSKKQTCSVCGYENVVKIPKLGHTYSTDWSNDTTNHWHECSCGEKELQTAHTYGEFLVTKEATHIEDGSKKQTCSVCGYENVVKIPKLGHTYSTDWSNDTTNHWHECSCGEKELQTAHTYGEFVVTKEATHTEDGSKKQTCSVCGYENVVVIEKLGHDLVHHDAKDPTCTEIGWNEYYSCSSCDYTTYQEIAAIGHTYGSPAWTWNGYESAKAKFICGNDSSHVEEISAIITSEVTTPAACEDTGVRTYTATVTFDGNTYTDTKTEEIPATGHSYGSPAWTWNEYESAKAKFICGNDSSHVEEIRAVITSEVTTPAACEATGVRKYTATVTFGGKTYTDTKTEEIPATGHSYGSPAWTWNGYESAKAKFICGNDSSHIEEISAIITSEVTTPAACEATGDRTYTATVTFGGKIYTDTNTEEIPATGHSYGSPAWTWNGYESAKAKFICGNDSSHIEEISAVITSEVTTPAACEATGDRTYTATVTFGGNTYTDTKTEEIPATGHSYGSPAWTWNGYESAKAKFICGNDNSHIEEISAVITSEVTTPAACEATGDRTYTATVTFGGNTYTDTNTEEIPATGHSYGSPAWTWNGYESAKAKFICGNDSSHIEEISAIITSEVTTPAACETTGDRTYTATVTFGGNTYTNTKTEEIPATGHTYGNLIFANAPTCEDDGNVAHYHCSECEKYFNTKKEEIDSIVIPAIGHTEVIDAAVAATCESKGKTEGKHCSVCNKVLVAQQETEKLEHLTEKGVCSVCGYVEPSLGLAFDLLEDGTYKIVGLGSCVEYNIINIPNKYNDIEVTSIGDFAFDYCRNLTSIEIPASVTSIGEYAFRECNNLTSIEIPANVTSIGNYAFEDCYRLVEVVNRSSLSIEQGSNSNGHIGYYALQIITDEKKSKLYTENDFVLYKESEDSIILISYIGNATDIVVPSGVTSINGYAFYGCRYLKSITFAEGNQLTSIGDYAFYNCSNLTSIEIPASLTSIGDYAFRSCSNLTSIEIPASVTRIGDKAFYECYRLVEVVNKSSALEITKGSPNNGHIGYYALQIITDRIASKLYTYNDFVLYKESEDSIILISYNGNATDIVVPSKVTSIRSYAFYKCSNLTSIEIPASVKSIGEFAFKFCSNLTGVTFVEGSKLTSIANYAFQSCSNLISIEIPAGVTSIGDYAFQSCSNLTSIEIPAGVKSIGEYAFNGCSNLISIEIPASVTSIGAYAFESCSNLSTVTFVEGSKLTSIGNYIFRNCSNLTSIEIPASVTSIGNYAFDYCSNLTSIEIPASVTSIGNCAFNYCSNLTSIEIPASVTSIGDYAFQGCSSLSTVTFAGESQLTSISSYAFQYCSNLTSIKIPANVTSIGNYAFYKCSNLSTVTFTEGSKLTSIGDYAFYRCSNLTRIEIPASVTSIEDYAFYYCYKLVEVVNKSSLQIKQGSDFYGHIGYYALQIITDEKKSKLSTDENGFVLYKESEDSIILISYNGNATDIEVPLGVTSIRNYAFYYCSKLTSIKIPVSVTSIGDYAFESCSNLISIEISANVTSIGDYAFRECSNLSTVTFREGSQLTSTGLYAFLGCSNLRSIEIPASVTSIGKYAFQECSNLNTVTFREGSQLTSIGSYAFYKCSNLRSIEIPASVTSIGGFAFQECSNLNTVTFAEGSQLTSIGSNSFYYCSKLTSIEIPANVTSIDLNAFYGCYRLVEVINKSALEITKGSPNNGQIGYYALQIITDRIASKLYTYNDFVLYKESEDSIILISYNGNATDIVVPSGVTSINRVAFQSCSNLTSIEIPASVTSIGSSAFSGCNNLTSIKIPASVTSIGSSAFEYCNNLTSVYYTGTASNWDNISINSGNSFLTDATLYYYSETEPSEEGNYWHYVDGEIVVWTK